MHEYFPWFSGVGCPLCIAYSVHESAGKHQFMAYILFLVWLETQYVNAPSHGLTFSLIILSGSPSPGMVGYNYSVVLTCSMYTRSASVTIQWAKEQKVLGSF